MRRTEKRTEDIGSWSDRDMRPLSDDEMDGVTGGFLSPQDDSMEPRGCIPPGGVVTPEWLAKWNPWIGGQPPSF